MIPPLRVVQTPGPASALNIAIHRAAHQRGPPIDMNATLTDALGNGITGVTIFVSSYSTVGCVTLDFNKGTPAAGLSDGRGGADVRQNHAYGRGLLDEYNAVRAAGDVVQNDRNRHRDCRTLFPVITPIGISSIKFRIDVSVYEGTGHPANNTVTFDSGGVGTFSATSVPTSEVWRPPNSRLIKIRRCGNQNDRAGTGTKKVSVRFKSESSGNAYLAYSGDIQPLLNVTKPASVPAAIQTAAVGSGKNLVSPCI